MLDNAGFDLHAGEVLAVIGDNGAEQPDGDALQLNGAPAKFDSPDHSACHQR